MINLENIKPAIRYLKEMTSVLYDREWLKEADLNQPLYYMYRGVKQENNLRYDITIIPPFYLGRELVKTKGHYHQGSYQEVYQVLEGRAIYLFQRGENDYLEDVVAIYAKAGDVVIVPPKYGHITINPGKEILKMANWVSKKCHSDYSQIEKFGGGAYFYTINGWIKNLHYLKVPPLRIEEPKSTVPSDLSFLDQG